MTRVSIVGAGYWAPNLIRNFYELGADIVSVCDLDRHKLDKLATERKYKGIRLTTDFNDILRDDGIEAVVVATPTKTHFDVATQCLETNKSVLVEKPMTYDPKDSLRLIDQAKLSGQVLMVGHVFLYNAISRALKERLTQRNIKYMNSQRTGLGPVRQDVSAMWDLAPHDIVMFNYFTGMRPEAVFANGKTYVQHDRGLEDVVSMSLDYPQGIVGNILVSWIDPVKTRKVTVVCSDKMYVFDDVQQSLVVYDKGVNYQPATGEFGDFKLSIRDGDVVQPKIKMNEPLRDECAHFLDCVKSKHRPYIDGNIYPAHYTDGKNGYDVVAVLDAAQKSLREGRKIKVEYER